MLFSWWQQRQRRKIVAQPLPEQWERILRENAGFYGLLDDHAQRNLRQSVQIFVAEKYWEGCQGLAVTDEMKVTIAAHACLLVLGFEGNYFDRLQSVLVYPDTYVVPEATHDSAGVVTEENVPRLGETWFQGPVILSWEDVLYDARNYGEGYNVVLHEFAHYLDMQDWEFNGTPPLETDEEYRRWQEVMTAAYQRLVRQSRRGVETLIDDYGATNPAEFFAVATECFFERPRELAEEQPKVYGVLKSFYKQDPAGWGRS